MRRKICIERCDGIKKLVYRGAMAVQRTTYSIVFYPHYPVAPIPQPPYIHSHKGWMALVEIEFLLPHNPLVSGLLFYVSNSDWIFFRNRKNSVLMHTLSAAVHIAHFLLLQIVLLGL
jgi:hypothetical protein